MRARYRHVYLLASLAMLLVIRPFVELPIFGVAVVDVLLITALVASLFACSTRPIVVAFAGAFLVASLVIRYAGGDGVSPLRLGLYLGMTALFLAAVAASVTRHVFLDTARVSADTIYGALSVYLLLGFLWAFAYALIEVAVPGSFEFGAGVNSGSTTSFDRFIGFSFVTLTTLGYGNIVPATKQADAIAIAEALTGQIYLTVLVARLVALHLAESLRGGDREPPRELATRLHGRPRPR